MRAEIGRFGVKHDYRGAHVLDWEGRLATIAEVYYRESPPAFMARLKRFNGEDAGEQALATLDLLDRTTEAKPKPDDHYMSVGPRNRFY